MSSRSISVTARGPYLENEGVRLFRAGQLVEAESLFNQLLAMDKSSPKALFMLGLIHLSKGAKQQAEAKFRRCVKLDSRHVGAQFNLGKLLLERGRTHEALACFNQAESIEPDNFRVPYVRAKCLEAMTRYGEALAGYRQALAMKPDYAEAARDLGILLRRLGQFDEAERILLDLTRGLPNLPEPWLNLGKMYRLQGRIEEARTAFETACRIEPNNREAMLGLAWAMIHTNDIANAEALIQHALHGMATPGAEVFELQAEVKARQGDLNAAITFMTQAITAGARSPYEYLTLAYWYGMKRERGQAVRILEEGGRQLGDSTPSLEIALFYNRQCICDWRDYSGLLARVKSYVRDPNPGRVQPFIGLQIPDLTSDDLYHLTAVYSQQYAPWRLKAFSPKPRSANPQERLRIGYLSADFYEHATAYLTAEVFEHHCREKFVIYAYSYGPDDQSPTRLRLESAFDHFVDLRMLDHLSAAKRIVADGIDILVDLKGYTQHARAEILALRPAPIQVNWLGYPGTMAVDFMDYIIVDKTVVPPAEAKAYSEALAYLPHAYAPVDLKRNVGPKPDRAQVGLPPSGFVFCCFNNPRKITPDFFERWCRILAAVPNSMLWLYADSADVSVNLRREAASRALDPERLIFAEHVSQDEHLSRLTLADLVLDTLPYNAHTTTSDALLMGVPVLTCLGMTFPGRVAASLLRAAGVPELVTLNIEEYEAKAIELAKNPSAYMQIRRQLEIARDLEPYFNPAGFTQELESLYNRMWQRRLQGLPADLLDPLLSGTH